MNDEVFKTPFQEMQRNSMGNPCSFWRKYQLWPSDTGNAWYLKLIHKRRTEDHEFKLLRVSAISDANANQSYRGHS